MKARVQVWDKSGITYAGLLPTTGLSFSEEVGGVGTCTFEALKSDLDALKAWDSVIKISLEIAPDVWMLGPSYVIRKSYTNRVGARRYSITTRSLMEAWSSEAVLLPEYAVGTVPRHSGTERGLGWMATAYDPTTDAVDWNKLTISSRSTYPKNWPPGSNAKWISATTATGQDAKFFRSTITIPAGAAQTVKFWLSADESSTLWVGGEKVIETSSSETGYESFKTAKRIMSPDKYAVGIYSVTDSSVSGGLPGDPVVMCAGIINPTTGAVTTWLTATGTPPWTWLAARRSVDPPGDVPPGPTPGAMLQYLVNEVGPSTKKGRSASGWAGVGMSFDAAKDSYGKSWGALDIVERMYAYGTTTYWAIFQAFAESDECDVWMTDRTLHAAPRQGQIRTLTFTEQHLRTLTVTGTEGSGTWVLARAHSGWVAASLAGQPRREYAIEVGQSITTAVATKVAKASLRDAWRRDASASLNPPRTGWMPYVDFKIGDVVNISYLVDSDNSDLDIVEQMSITSLSATAGEGGLLWDIEFTEYPPPAVPT